MTDLRNNNLDNLIVFFRGFNKWVLIGVIIFINHLISIIISVFFELNNPIEDKQINIYEKLFLICVLGPIIETLLFQTLIIKIVRKYFKNNFLAVLVSAFLFGIAHNYSGPYIVATFVMGVTFGLFYIIREKQSPTINVIIVHSLYNLFGVVIYDIIIPHFK